MFQGSFKSYVYNPEHNITLILGIGSFPINIKIGSLTTFANSSEGVQGYKIGEVNKMIATMLTGWDLLNPSNVIKPKSMSDNYIELVLSCDSGFCIKKKMQFPHIVEWNGEDQRFNYNEAYKEFSLDNWIKSDDFATPDITLAMNPTDEIMRKSGESISHPTTDNSGMFSILYRNLPVGVNRIRVIFHIKTQTEPIEFDLEVKDGKFTANPEVKNTNLFIKNAKELYQFNGAGQPFEEITPYEWQQLYVNSEVYFLDNKITHDLFFYPYV